MNKRAQIFILLSLVVLIGLSGCDARNEAVTPTVPAEPPQPAVATDTPSMPADTPQVPGMVIILYSPEADPAQVGEVQAAVSEVISGRGLVVEDRQDLTLQNAPANLLLVAMVGAPPGVGDLTSGLPDVKFLGIGSAEWPGTANMYVYSAGGGNLPNQAFLAGYIAAVQSEEYRIGVIGVNDAAGQDYRKAFLNGVIYFCGTCTPVFPPFKIYPLYVEVPEGADMAALENAAQTLIASGVNMIHVAPPVQSEPFYQYLAQNGILLVGTEPPPAGLEGSWVASVIDSGGISLENTLTALLDGQQVAEGPSTIEISYAGVSEARLAHFYEILAKLESGEIDPVGP